MRGRQSFGLLLKLVAVTACAPVVYDATYLAPMRHVSTHTAYSQRPDHYVTVYRKTYPIEVTLYANNTYQGIYFQPMHLTITDGQYVKIPIRDRRGRQSGIYAHYHQNNLHFDADRNCQGKHDSSSFSYDSRWDKGHLYSNINAGKDYDLTGIQLQIRKVPTYSLPISKNVAVKQNNTASHGQHFENQPPAKKPFVTIQEENKRRVAIIYKDEKDERPAGHQTAVVAVKTAEKPLVENKDKHLITKDNIVNTTNEKVADKKQAASQKPTKGRAEDVEVPQSHNVVKAQRSNDNKREVVFARNDRTDEEDGANSRSNGKTDALDHVSQSKWSR